MKISQVASIILTYLYKEETKQFSNSKQIFSIFKDDDEHEFIIESVSEKYEDTGKVVMLVNSKE